MFRSKMTSFPRLPVPASLHVNNLDEAAEYPNVQTNQCVNEILYGMFLNSSRNSKTGWKGKKKSKMNDVSSRFGKKGGNGFQDFLLVKNTFIQKSCKLHSRGYYDRYYNSKYIFWRTFENSSIYAFRISRIRDNDWH